MVLDNAAMRGGEVNESIRTLQNELTTLPLLLEQFEVECQLKINAQIELNSKSKTKPTKGQCIEFLESVFSERDAYLKSIATQLDAITKSSKEALPGCARVKAAIGHDIRKLSKDLVFDAVAELEMIQLAAIDASTPRQNVDPFEFFHDGMKNEGATDKDIAKAWIESRSPKERNLLLTNGKYEAIDILTNRCRNLRLKRKNDRT